MKKIILLFLFTVCSVWAADEKLKEYEFVRSAKSDGSKAEMVAVRFDNHLYKNTNNDYSNILIIGTDGRVVPFAVRDLTDKSGAAYSLKITGFSRNIKKNTAEIELTLPQEKRFDSIEFITDNRRFDKDLDITFYAADGKIVRNDKNLKLYRYDDLYGNSIVEFPEIKAQKMLVVINNFLEKKDLTVSAETVSRDEKTVQKKVRTEEFNIKKIMAKDRTAGKKHFLTFELPEIRRRNLDGETQIEIDACRIPPAYLTIKADDRYYSRLVTLEYQEINGKSSKTFSVNSFYISEEGKEIAVPALRADKLILTIINNDNAPLKNITMSWKIADKILLAEAQNGEPLKIYYGGRAAKKYYDIEKYADKLIFSKHSFYQLENAEKSPFFAPSVPHDEIKRYIMWAVFALVVIILGAVIVKMLFSMPEE